MEDLKKYLDLLESNSFDEWSEDEKYAYLTCLISVKEFIKKLEHENED
jgi:hypothetical protein